MPTEKIIDNDIDQLEGKSAEDLQQMLNQELGHETPTTPDAPPEGEQPPADKEPESESPPAPAEDPQAVIARLEKRLADKEAFILQRNAEIGMLRKQVKATSKPVELDIPEEEFHTNPKEAVKRALAEFKQKTDAGEQEEKEAEAKSLEETRTIFREAITKWAPDYEEKRVAAIADVLKRDGAPEQLVKSLREEPYATLPPPVVFQLLKRVDAENKVKELEAKLAEATKKPGQIVNKMQNASRSKPVVTGSAPSSKAHQSLETLTEADIDSMSREELEKLYKTLK